jgi:tRNA (guanine-N7-)-methyltransferase
MTNDDSVRPPRAFFGRRKGHALKPAQAGLFETLLPQLALDPGALPADLRQLFPVPVDAVRLEIGFGGGEHLVHEAESVPRTGFIGVEPFINGMAKALAAISARGLRNVRLYHGDAIEVLAGLPDAALVRVDLIHPDPWPKRRHWKRRFVQDETVASIARVLGPGGEFRFVSDIPDYAAWTLVRLLRSPAFAWTAERADDWRQPWPGFSGTRYGAKAHREGRAPCFLVFRRHGPGA